LIIKQKKKKLLKKNIEIRERKKEKRGMIIISPLQENSPQGFQGSFFTADIFFF
jgi:hypothetical protein